MYKFEQIPGPDPCRQQLALAQDLVGLISLFDSVIIAGLIRGVALVSIYYLTPTIYPMPNTKSAIKAMRQNIKRRKINLKVLESVRKSAKQVRKAATAGKKDELNKALSAAFSALDKAAKKNVIHKNNASRKKSRLAAMAAKASK